MRITGIIGLVALALSASAANNGLARTVNVGPGQDHATIAAAVAAMQPGDVCLVAPGTYPEYVVLGTALRGDAQRITVVRSTTARGAMVQGFGVNGAEYVRIEGFDISNSLTYPGVHVETGGHVEIVDNYFHDIADPAISAAWRPAQWVRGVTVLGNTIERCNKGINIAGYDWVVENNTVTRLKYYDEDCDYARFFGENLIIRGNRFFDTRQAEIGESHVDSLQTYDNNGEWVNGVLIEGNFLADSHQSIFMEAKTYGKSANVTIRNNVFARQWAHSITGYHIQNLQVDNNLFIDQTIGIRFRMNSTGTIRNNIFYNCSTSYYADGGATFQSAANLFHNSKVVAGTGNITANPQFAYATGENYQISADSPCVNAGVVIEGRAYDFAGAPIIGLPDIGIYEYQGPPATPEPTVTGAPTITPTPTPSAGPETPTPGPTPISTPVGDVAAAIHALQDRCSALEIALADAIERLAAFEQAMIDMRASITLTAERATSNTLRLDAIAEAAKGE